MSVFCPLDSVARCSGIHPILGCTGPLLRHSALAAFQLYLFWYLFKCLVLRRLVVDEYFDVYFPRAASVGEQMDALGQPGKRLQWLSHSFLTSMMDSCPIGY